MPSSLPRLTAGICRAAAALAFVLLLAPLYSQSDDALPDSPVPQASQPATGHINVITGHERAYNKYDKYIDPGQPAAQLTAHDKVILGVRDAFSPISFAAWVGNAGFEQVINGKPHYGTNKEAFAERFGAAAARDISEDLFSESILAPVLHEDPRYYILGRHENVLHRVGYAVTRVLITRNDAGKPTVNLSLLAGNFAGAALTQAYYPPEDRGVNKTVIIWAGSEGGSAIGFLVNEFFATVYESLRLKAASHY